VVVRATRKLASKMELQDDKLWYVKRTGGTAKIASTSVKVEVVDKVERIKEVLIMLHDGMGHRALRSCYNLFRQRFWVPGAAKIIARHIAACRQCQQFAKPNPLAVPGYSVSPTDVFSHWSIDFAGPFPEDVTTGAKYAILAVDWLSRWAEAEPTKDASPEAAAEFIYNNIVTRYRCPISLQSDNGTHFINPIIRILCKILKVKHHLSTSYYPQSNGKIERVVGTIKTMLKRAVQEAVEVAAKKEVGGDNNIMAVGAAIDAKVLAKVREGEGERLELAEGIEEDEPKEAKKAYWAPLLQSVLWAYRVTPHTITGVSPAMLALGIEPRLPVDLAADDATMKAPGTDDEHQELVAKRLRYLYDAILGLREVKEQKAVDRGYRKYELGEKVWKRESKYDAKGYTPVFAPRWTGPFVIHAIWDKNVYKLRTDPLVTRKKVGYLRNAINGHRLKPYVEGELI